MLTADHGELLGAHGGLHQKWFNIYDEATRVPFAIARIGERATQGRIVDAPTSHVDLVPTLLAVASIDEAETASKLGETFSEVHLLPGRNLMPVVDRETDPADDWTVYLMTRDNMLEGDHGIPGLLRRRGRTTTPPPPLQIRVPAHVGSNFEALVTHVDDGAAEGGAGHLWKLVRTFDDPATWTEPGVRHLAANGPAGESYRTVQIPDQWELYDLDADPIEAQNLWNDPAAADVFAHVRFRLKERRAESVPERHKPWPYESRHPLGGPKVRRPPPPARVLRRAIQKLGMHPDDQDAVAFDLDGRRALIVATNTAVMDIGKPTGVFASEMTVPYYAFLDAGIDVDVASPLGGVIPVDPMSLKPVIRCADDDRFLADDTFRHQVSHSLRIADVDIADYDIVFLAGGWGAAFDFGFSDALADKITEANALGTVIGGVCHGPLGLINADRHRRPPARAGPAGLGGHRQAGDGARHRDHPTPSRARASCAGRRVRERDSLPRPARQPLGRRRQPRDRPEPERRTDGRPRDDATRDTTRVLDREATTFDDCPAERTNELSQTLASVVTDRLIGNDRELVGAVFDPLAVFGTLLGERAVGS